MPDAVFVHRYACELAQRKGRWLRERAQLQASVKAVTRERDEALEECDRLRAEVKQALEECDRLRAGGATVCREPNELTFQRRKKVMVDRDYVLYRGV